MLGPLALWLREENPTAGLVSEERLIDWLTEHFMGEDWGLKRGAARERAREFLDSVRKYSNLLLERGQGRYGFMHLTFEEALAARGLVQTGQLKLDDSLAVIRQLPHRSRLARDDLAGGGRVGPGARRAAQGGRGGARDLEDGLRRATTPARNVLLAGACLEDVGEMGLGRAVANEVTEALLAACAQPIALARPSNAMPVSFWAAWAGRRTIWTPSSRFPPGRSCTARTSTRSMIEQPYQIAKYPVTNLQYRRFVDAGGYEKREYWSEDGWAWRTGTYDSKAHRRLREDWLAKRPPEKRA